jgi:HNH endonuclease/AP2 domain
MPKKYNVKRHVVTQPLDQPYRLIPLTQGKTAIVDEKDFDWLSQWFWCASERQHTGLFVALNKDLGLMHRFILGCSSENEVDHRNHNPLDNRRSNLRKCSRLQNASNVQKPASNTSGFIGVSFLPNRTKGWRARIRIANRHKTLGYFLTPEEAAHEYDRAARKYRGSFSGILNFPQ